MLMMKKRCYYCGEKIEKGKEVNYSEKLFCNEEHAETFSSKLKESEGRKSCCH